VTDEVSGGSHSSPIRFRDILHHYPPLLSSRLIGAFNDSKKGERLVILSVTSY